MGRIPPECSELLSTVVCYMSGSKLPKKASRTRLGDHGAVCPLHVLVCARAVGAHMGRGFSCPLSAFCGTSLGEKARACLWCPLGPGAHLWCLLGTGVIVLSGVAAW